MMLAALVLAAGLVAGQADDVGVNLPQCGLPVRITRALLAALPDGRLTGAGDAKSALLVGDLTGQMHGTVAFLRMGGKWQAFAVSPGSSSVGVFRAGRGGAAFVWTMPDIEGPGQQFDALSMSGSGGDRFCTRILFPTTLNNPQWQSEFLELGGFNIDAKGIATLIGTADVEREVARKGKRKPKRQQVRLVYRYVSTDGGRRWSTPAPAVNAAIPGLYDRITGAPTDLVASLRAQVK